MLDEMRDRVDKLLDASERGPPQGALRDQPEPALHLIKPGGRDRCEVQVEARPLRPPGAHFRMLVGGIAVDHQMQVEILRRLLVDQPQECEKLLMAVTLVAFADHLAGRHVKRGEQCRGSVAHIVVGVAFGIAQSSGSAG